MQNEAEFFELIVTGDGSPSFKIQTPGVKPEAMHHLGGAWSETVHIYGRALELLLDKREELGWGGQPLEVVSVGLGLGYNEILAAAISLKRNASKDLRVTSYEIEPSLIASFQEFFSTPSHLENPQTESEKVRKSILALAAKHYQVKELDVFLWVAEALKDGSLVLKGDFLADANLLPPYNLMFYDPFSDRVDDKLWDETFLDEIFAQGARQKLCVFATYAAKGRIKRLFKKHGFTKVEFEGFGGKKENSIGVRYLSI